MFQKSKKQPGLKTGKSLEQDKPQESLLCSYLVCAFRNAFYYSFVHGFQKCLTFIKDRRGLGAKEASVAHSEFAGGQCPVLAVSW